MLECLKKNMKLKGYIDGKQYLDKKQNQLGSLEGNLAIKISHSIFLGKTTSPLFLQNNGSITKDQVSSRLTETFGFLKDKRIYHFKPKHLKKLRKMKKKGQIEDESIYNLPDTVLAQFPDALIYQITANKTQILDAKGRPVLILNGPSNEIEQLSELDFFGIVAVFLDLDRLFLFRNTETGFDWAGLIYCIGIFIGAIIVGAVVIAGVIFNVFHWFQENPITIPGFEPLLFMVILASLVGLIILWMHFKMKNESSTATLEEIASK